MDAKMPGDLVYILGLTRNEMGASEYYEHFGYTGANVPQVRTEEFLPLYRALHDAMEKGLAASVHAVCRGGLGIHLAMVCMAGNLGMDIALDKIHADKANRDDILLFSESAGRFIITIAPEKQQAFEKIFAGLACACIGTVTENPELLVRGKGKKNIIRLGIDSLKSAWKKPFGDLI